MKEQKLLNEPRNIVITGYISELDHLTERGKYEVECFDEYGIKMNLEDSNKNYKSVRIKIETYKKIKLLAVKMDMPITRLIEIMFDEFKKSHE
ncbi:MAG: hypothetical protein PHW53_04940 [Patescibacteria group bacterium]|nr:hypothetical protein [Patescibacteria group bacterium]